MTATDLLSELSAADNASRPSYALAALCKLAAERIRELESDDASELDHAQAELKREMAAHEATKREAHEETKRQLTYVLTRVSKAVLPGATKHPAHDVATLLGEVDSLKEHSIELQAALEAAPAHFDAAHAATKRELELSVEVIGFLARHWAVGMGVGKK